MKKIVKLSDKNFFSKLIPDSPEIICLCGQMAAGKNFAAQKLCSQTSDKKCVSIDLDKTVHLAIEKLTPQILQTFEKDAKKAKIELQNKDGSLNRRALGVLIFARPGLLKKQEDLVYPETVRLVKEFIAQNKDKTVFLNATVLYKTPQLLELCSKIYFVTSPFIKRLVRAKRRDKMPLTPILRRFKTQNKLLSEYKKTKLPLIFIKN